MRFNDIGPPTICRPNFFILGAPKCATTSMTGWLQTHPLVFIPTIKEPHFFNTDDRCLIQTLAAYERLFSAATSKHRAIGEASVWYLSSEVAVANILAYQPQARFIVMLRNPIEMAPALHSEMLLSGHENVRDFYEAWLLQEQRRKGQKRPVFTWATRRLQYGPACSLGVQLRRLLAAVGRERVLTILLDDIILNPRQVYLEALQFLGLDDDGRVEFPALNTSRNLRCPRLVRALFILGQLSARYKIGANSGFLQRLMNRCFRESPRHAIAPATQDMLREYFTADIHLLARLLGRNLDHWLGAEPRSNSVADANGMAPPHYHHVPAVADCT